MATLIPRERILALVSERYGMDPARCFDIRQSDLDGDWMLAYSAPPLPDAVQRHMIRVSQLLEDEFRGAVIKAATPEFAARVGSLLNCLIENSSTQRIRITDREIQEVLKNSSHRRAGFVGL